MNKLSAVFIGVMIAIMITFNGIFAKQTNDYLSVLIVHIAGILTVSLILIIKKKKVVIDSKIPKYLFLAGAIGVFVTLFNNMCINKLGVSLTLALGLLGQSILSGIIDHFGLLGMKVHRFKPKKLIGFAIVFIGIIIMMVY